MLKYALQKMSYEIILFIAQSVSKNRSINPCYNKVRINLFLDAFFTCLRFSLQSTCILISLFKLNLFLKTVVLLCALQG